VVLITSTAINVKAIALDLQKEDSPVIVTCDSD
jgi:hypothetical protein